MHNPIKVVLADESRSVRLLLASLLRGDTRFEVVAAVATGEDVVEHSRDADLVVLDLVLHDMDAFTAIDAVHGLHPRLPVVVFAAVDPPYLRSQADARGAAGYFTHATDPGQLLDGLASAVGGERP